MAEGWLDNDVVRRLCLAIAGVHILVAVINLAYIPSELREYEAWKSHIESPVVEPPPGPAQKRMSLKVEAVRFAKQELDLDRECNFTTWLSSVQGALLAAATLLLSIKTRRREWLAVMLGFLYFSMDELCQVHEWVGLYLSNIGFRIGSLGPPYPWVIVLGPIFLAYAGGVLAFLNRELHAYPKLRRLAFLGLVVMASSLPLEVLGGQLQGDAPRPPRLEVIAEETLESLGGVLLLFTFVTLLIQIPAAVRNTVESRKA